MRASKTVLKLGTLLPKLPTVLANDSRLLPQTFGGGQLTSLEVEGLTVDGGRLKQVNQRDSTDYEDMSITKTGAKGITTPHPTSDSSISPASTTNGPATSPPATATAISTTSIASIW